MTPLVYRSSRTLVVDTSAIIAIATGEQEQSTFLLQLGYAPRVAMSYVTLFEVSIVLLKRTDSSDQQVVKDVLQQFNVKLFPADAAQIVLAVDAYQRFGKGRHPAALNFGDCFSYALAKHLNEPLLFKGEDFRQTDVLVA